MWLTILLYIVIIYLVLCIVFYFAQDLFFFRPEILPKSFKYKYEFPFDEIHFDMEDGGYINGLHFKVPNSKGVVFYFKGNSRSVKGWGKFAIDFTRHGFDVFMVDYRGFGKSIGKRSQKAIKRDLQLVYNKMRERVPEQYIILYGRSLGSGFATKLASMNNPRMLILDAPYYSLAKVTGRYMPFMPLSLILKYPMPTYKWIKYVNCPIHIIHGTNDKLIPLKSSVKLSKINAQRTRLYPVIGGGHKNLNNFESYHKMLGEIINFVDREIDLETTSIGVKHSVKK